MLIVEEHHVIEYLAACAAYESLRDGIHVRRANRLLITFAPTPCATRSNAGPNLSSRSRSSTAGTSPSIVALRSCCAVHAWVGWRVAATWTTRRDAPWTMKNA